MEEVIKSISKYNILNYLIPGTIFCILLRLMTPYDLIQPEITIGLFLYYFVGMIISRVGSLIVEPLFKFVGILKYAPYDAYVEASQKDSKIEQLSETNNIYRTVVAMCMMLLMLILTSWLVIYFQIEPNFLQFVVVVFLIILFVASHRKQTNFIKKRIEIVTQSKSNKK